jgi:uncharacterized protein (DUF1015 family)
MNIHPFVAEVADLTLVPSPDAFYSALKNEYPSFKDSGFFERIEDPVLVLYQIKRKNTKHLGIIACVDTDAFTEGNILKHEHTLPEKEQVMTNLIFQRRAMIKPVLLTHLPYQPMKSWMQEYKDQNEPDFKVKINSFSEKHSMWFIRDQATIKRFQKAYKEEIGKAYIADGHHRSSITFKLRQFGQGERHHLDFNRLFAAFFDFDELEVYDYNRLVDLLSDISATKLMAGLSQYFDITILDIPRKPLTKHEITMGLQQEWYSLKWKPEILTQYTDSPVLLDAYLLDDIVFSKLLRIEAVSTDSRFSYMEGTKEIEDILQRMAKKPNSIAFCLYPIDLMDIILMADQGRIMPPKSTWFEPRIRNGVVVLPLGT